MVEGDADIIVRTDNRVSSERLCSTVLEGKNIHLSSRLVVVWEWVPLLFLLGFVFVLLVLGNDLCWDLPEDLPLN